MDEITQLIHDDRLDEFHKRVAADPSVASHSDDMKRQPLHWACSTGMLQQSFISCPIPT